MKHLLAAVFVVLALTGTVDAQYRSSLLVGQKVENSNFFEIQGTITSVNDSSFIVRGELIAASGENMDRFKANNLLDIGNFVSVKGEIKNNMMIAQDVTKLGRNPEADKNDMKGIRVETITNPDNKSIIDGIVNAIKNILFNQ